MKAVPLLNARYEMWAVDDPSLGGRPPSQWSRSEAEANAQRLSDLLPQRVRALRRFLGLEEGASNEALLRKMDPLLARMMARPEFGYWDHTDSLAPPEGYPSLTSQGVALCTDAGLLVCDALMTTYGDALALRARVDTRQDDAYRNQVELWASHWDGWQAFSIVWMSGVEGVSMVRQGLHPQRGFANVYLRHSRYMRKSHPSSASGSI